MRPILLGISSPITDAQRHQNHHNKLPKSLKMQVTDSRRRASCLGIPVISIEVERTYGTSRTLPDNPTSL